MYNVNEGDEVVQPELILSNPSSSVITVQVNDNGTTATGKLDQHSQQHITIMALQKVMIIILDHTWLSSLLDRPMVHSMYQ